MPLDHTAQQRSNVRLLTREGLIASGMETCTKIMHTNPQSQKRIKMITVATPHRRTDAVTVGNNPDISCTGPEIWKQHLACKKLGSVSVSDL